MICSLCPHRCRAARDERGGEGRCRLPSTAYAARAALQFGEEPCLSGTRGSGAVFFSGCTLSCVFCQNAEISRSAYGIPLSPEALADVFRDLVRQGAHNIHLVSPTPYIPVIRRAMARYRPPVPVVYNTGGYERVESLRALEGFVDIYLPDFKYGDEALAVRLSGAPGYPSVALDAIEEMRRQTGDIERDGNGIARRGTMVRHLVLPGHLANTEEALRLLSRRFGSSLWVSLLFQYTPVMRVAEKELCRALTRRECEKAFALLCDAGFENGYTQEFGCAGTGEIPAFDLTGLPMGGDTAT